MFTKVFRGLPLTATLSSAIAVDNPLFIIPATGTHSDIGTELF